MEVRPTTPLAGKRICIDPGHGGYDTGAIGPTGVNEKDVNLAIALDVRDELTAQGATVIMTRDTDRSVAPEGSTHKQELQARCDIATRAKADIFVSVHSNAADKPAPNGMETYHARNASAASIELSNDIYESMTSQIPLHGRGVQAANFHVIYKATMPAELTEVAFVTNPAEEKLLATPEFQKKMAHAIAGGVTKYFRVNADGALSTTRPPEEPGSHIEPMPEDTLGFIAH
jgi:N-acetylmuramoyl-L-alanine amidase